MTYSYISRREGIPRLDIVLTAEAATPEKIRGAACVVIDVLRASTTITTALAHGCAGVIPVETPEEARKIAAERNCLLGGERGGVRIEGFDFGNSPLEYVAEGVSGRLIAFTTTNGTRAIRACSEAPLVVVASFLNGSAVVRFLNSCEERIIIVCAGTRGAPSIEDTVCGGMLLDRLQGDRSLAAQEAVSLWRTHHRDLAGMMKRVSTHGKTLVDLGFEQDIEFAAGRDAYDIVAVRKNDLIVKETS